MLSCLLAKVWSTSVVLRWIRCISVFAAHFSNWRCFCPFHCVFLLKIFWTCCCVFSPVSLYKSVILYLSWGMFKIARSSEDPQVLATGTSKLRSVLRMNSLTLLFKMAFSIVTAYVVEFDANLSWQPCWKTCKDSGVIQNFWFFPCKT